jgi:hypothetical protein
MIQTLIAILAREMLIFRANDNGGQFNIEETLKYISTSSRRPVTRVEPSY